jgi:hypothetical protein
MRAKIPGSIQRVTATMKTNRVLRSPLENEPSLRRSSSKRPDKQEDDGVDEAAEDDVSRGVISIRAYLWNVEQYAQGQREDSRHRDRDGLREPVDYGECEYGCQRVLVPLERQRQEVHDQERNRPEEETDRLPRLLEPLLCRGEHLPLLIERPVGASRPYIFSHDSHLL